MSAARSSNSLPMAPRALSPPGFARIDAEENLLRAQFGDEYNAYCSHTWRLIPGLY